MCSSDLLWCFTFQDYQLVPTLEEYAYLLNIKLSDEVPFVQLPEKPKFEVVVEILHLSWKEVKDNWKSSEGTIGFYLDFLVKKAEHWAKKGSWNDFSSLCSHDILDRPLPSHEKFCGFDDYLCF